MTTLAPFFAFTRAAPASAVLDDALNAFFRAPARRAVRAIPFEVTEQGDQYLVTAELPGVRKEDIQIEIDAARVTITAQAKSERTANEGERVLYSERSAGKAVRSFELGKDVDASQAKARYADGVLSLTLPKKSAESRKLLAVE
jgi:HSP20 family protein